MLRIFIEGLSGGSGSECKNSRHSISVSNPFFPGMAGEPYDQSTKYVCSTDLARQRACVNTGLLRNNND